MAKSMRSKSKRSFRRVKRESGVFAAADAARHERLHRKLVAKVNADISGDTPMQPETGEDDAPTEEQLGEGEDTAMVEGSQGATPSDGKSTGSKISRREERRRGRRGTRQSKGERRVNKHGVVAASKRAGRPKRRR